MNSDDKSSLQKELMNGIVEAWAQRKTLLDKISGMENELSNCDLPAASGTVHIIEPNKCVSNFGNHVNSNAHCGTEHPVIPTCHDQSRNNRASNYNSGSGTPSLIQKQAVASSVSLQGRPYQTHIKGITCNKPFMECGQDSLHVRDKSTDSGLAIPNYCTSTKSYGTSGIKLLCDLLNGTLPEYPSSPSLPASNQGTSSLFSFHNVQSPNEQPKQASTRPPPNSFLSKDKPFTTSSPFSISNLVNTNREVLPGNKTGIENVCGPLAGTTIQFTDKTSSASSPISLPHKGRNESCIGQQPTSVMDNRSNVYQCNSRSPVLLNTGTESTKTKSPPNNFSIAHLTKDLKSPTYLNQVAFSEHMNLNSAHPFVSFPSQQSQMYSSENQASLDNRANPPRHVQSYSKERDAPSIISHKDDRAELCNGPMITEPRRSGSSSNVVVADSPSTQTPPKRRPGRPRKYPPKAQLSKVPSKVDAKASEVSSILSPSRIVSTVVNKQLPHSTVPSCPLVTPQRSVFHDIGFTSLDSSDVEVSTLLAKEVEPQSPSISSSELKPIAKIVGNSTPGLVDSNPCSANSPIPMPSSPSLGNCLNVGLPSFDATFSPTKKQMPVNLPNSDGTQEDRIDYEAKVQSNKTDLLQATFQPSHDNPTETPCIPNKSEQCVTKGCRKDYMTKKPRNKSRKDAKAKQKGALGLLTQYDSDSGGSAASVDSDSTSTLSVSPLSCTSVGLASERLQSPTSSLDVASSPPIHFQNTIFVNGENNNVTKTKKRQNDTGPVDKKRPKTQKSQSSNQGFVDLGETAVEMQHFKNQSSVMVTTATSVKTSLASSLYQTSGVPAFSYPQTHLGFASGNINYSPQNYSQYFGSPASSSSYYHWAGSSPSMTLQNFPCLNVPNSGSNGQRNVYR